MSQVGENSRSQVEPVLIEVDLMINLKRNLRVILRRIARYAAHFEDQLGRARAKDFRSGPTSETDQDSQALFITVHLPHSGVRFVADSGEFSQRATDAPENRFGVMCLATREGVRTHDCLLLAPRRYPPR